MRDVISYTKINNAVARRKDDFCGRMKDRHEQIIRIMENIVAIYSLFWSLHFQDSPTTIHSNNMFVKQTYFLRHLNCGTCYCVRKLIIIIICAVQRYTLELV